ncbi:MAG: transporter substrate-binding domain-containing protein [Patescibacteria group bacterium]
MGQKNTFIYLSLMIAVVALVVSAYSINKTDQTNTANDTLARVIATGVLDACTVINPPTTIRDAKTGQLSGHMVEAMENIAERMKIKVNWHESTWGNAPLDLQSKRCDLLVAPFFANVPRAEAVAFTKPPLMYIGHSALVRKDDERFPNINSIFDFDKPEYTVVVATGEAGDIFVKEHFTKAKVNQIDTEAADLTRFAVEVSAGRADVAIGGSDTTAIYASEHDDVIDLFKENPYGLSPVGWAVRQDDIRWLNFIESSLLFLDSQGILKELEEKYNAHWLHEKVEYELW